jgi:GNAT superfamily N-acetyltransferase
MSMLTEGRPRADMGVTLQLDDFGKKALEAQLRGGSSRDAVVRAAARYYLADRESGRVAWRAPLFVRSVDPDGAGTDVELDEGTMEALEREARRQGIPASRLVEHALLYFLADVDSGRAALHLADEE